MNDFDVVDLVKEINAGIIALPTNSNANVRKLRKKYSQQLKQATPEQILTLANSLLDDPRFEPKFIAYELIHFHKPTLQILDQAKLEQLGRVLNGWKLVDIFAPYLSGVAWRNGQITDSVIHGWTQSDNIWWRRAALVSTIALNNRARGGKGDAPRTLGVCHLLVADRADMVVKAMSWALRTLIFW